MTPRLTLSQALAQKIRELLAEEGLSQREFAQRLGVSQGTVSYWLSAKRRQTALDIYEQLAAQFGLPLSRLFAELEGRVAAANPRPARRRKKGEDADVAAGAQVFGSPGTLGPRVRAMQATLQQLSREIVDALWSDYQARRQPDKPNGDVDPSPSQTPAAAGARPARGAG